MSISRRLLLKGLSVGSLLGALPASVRAARQRPRGPYEQLGITPVVNFVGTITTIGASKMWEDLHEAAGLASREYVVLLTVFMNDPGDEKTAVKRLKEIFKSSAAAR